MANMHAMMKQAQKLQKKMMAAQEESSCQWRAENRVCCAGKRGG